MQNITFHCPEMERHDVSVIATASRFSNLSPEVGYPDLFTVVFLSLSK